MLLLVKPYRKSDLARMVRTALDTAPALAGDKAGPKADIGANARAG